MWAPDKYLKELYQKTIETHSSNYDESWKAELTNYFLEALGEFPTQTADLYPITLETEEMETYFRIRVEITTLEPLRMPVYLLIPKRKTEQKYSAVLALHGHGYGSKEIVGLNPDGTVRTEPGIHKNFAVELVQRGVVVVAPELVGFGDRKLADDQNSSSPIANSCFSLASQLLLYGKTLAGLRIYECRRVLDFMMSRKEINNEKIGCMGLSGGGLIAAYTAVLDERIKATVISGYTNTFHGSIMARPHCLDNYIPGILRYAEMPEWIGLITPRPLFIEAGIGDHLFPVKQVKVALEKLEEIYSSFHAPDSLAFDFFKGKHEVGGQKSFDWLVRTLS